ncbi:collagen-like protein [Streptosporangium sp. NPDC048047]|uniref:collagen-like triple helix repeat-containing protein n=1 Tax=Streptosporangium sp. NPDC048047 TaxID=3155748 RepID=UPI00344A7917
MTDAEAVTGGPATRHDPDRPLPLHPLVYLEDGEEVTVGRPDTDSYAIFPVDGAELLRRLQEGLPPRAAAAWYAEHYHEDPDIDDLVAALGELGFIREPGEPGETGASGDPGEQTGAAGGPYAPDRPVRWRRLGTALFSVPAWICYAAVVAWAVVAMARRPDLVPSYRNVFFTDYYTVIQAALFVVAIPQLLLHESFHALAGRRLGLRSSLRISRRFYFVVLETSLDGLVAVPRRKRYLPIVAGMLADVVVMAALTITADLTRQPGGALSFAGRFCLAFAFAVLLRILWQFSLYLRTDLYVLVSTALGCVDLHTTARQMLANRMNRLLGRRDRLVEESDWHPVDRRVARWYSWLIVAGYTVSLTTFLVAVAPIVYEMFTGILGRFTGHGASWPELLDSLVFCGFILAQLVVLAWVAARERYRDRRQRLEHVIT